MVKHRCLSDHVGSITSNEPKQSQNQEQTLAAENPNYRRKNKITGWQLCPETCSPNIHQPELACIYFHLWKLLKELKRCLPSLKALVIMKGWHHYANFIFWRCRKQHYANNLPVNNPTTIFIESRDTNRNLTYFLWKRANKRISAMSQGPLLKLYWSAAAGSEGNKASHDGIKFSQTP